MRNTIGKPIESIFGTIYRALPLHKWRRPDGLASFLQDRVALRKTISLCHSCATSKMPTNWLARYDYEYGHIGREKLLADDSGCDYCKEVTTVYLFVAGEGAYHGEWAASQNRIEATRERDRKARERDPRLIIT